MADNNTPQWFAIVFRREFPPGAHWNTAAAADDSDRRQHWPTGALYSVGTVLADPLPAHLEAIPLSGPPQPGDVWNRTAKVFEPGPAA